MLLDRKVLVPVLVLIVLVVFGSIILSWLGYFDIPGIDTGPADLLIIGSPSLETIEVLDNSKDLVQYRVIEDVESFRTNPKDKIAQYDIIMLDQTNSEGKALPSQLGEELRGYVLRGGELIVVKDSGIYNTDALELVGWKANFTSEIVPVECIMTADNYPSCTTPVNLTAELERADFDHKIMMGIEKIPALPTDPYLYVEVLPIALANNGHEIATIRDAQSTKYYPGIVEKRELLGKSVYFNYNPGFTPGVFRNTLKYLS